jgi:hypothetical protein
MCLQGVALSIIIIAIPYCTMSPQRNMDLIDCEATPTSNTALNRLPNTMTKAEPLVSHNLPQAVARVVGGYMKGNRHE